MAELAVTYDREANAAYVYLTDPRTRTKVADVYTCDPVRVGGMINLDFDADGRLVGVEVLAADTMLPRSLLDAAERIDLAAD